MLEADELDFDFFADFVAGVINDDHGAAAEVRDTLMWSATDGDDFDLGVLAGEILSAEGEGKFVEV